jgi:hypothetical protein
VRTASIEVYAAAFVAPCAVIRRPGRPAINKPGLRGLLPGSDDPGARLLVTDDRAYDTLAALLPDARAGMINVCAAAARCTELLDADAVWTSTTSTAMICRDLQAMPAVALPAELTFRPVRRRSEDAPDGVPLEEPPSRRATPVRRSTGGSDSRSSPARRASCAAPDRTPRRDQRTAPAA